MILKLKSKRIILQIIQKIFLYQYHKINLDDVNELKRKRSNEDDKKKKDKKTIKPISLAQAKFKLSGDERRFCYILG